MGSSEESAQTASLRSNEAWIRKLRSDPPECNAALEDLHRYLLKGLGASFGHRKELNHEDLGDFVQEAMQKILERLDSFRGESKFTTWAMKVAINHTISELRRKRWQDISLDALEYPDALFSARRSYTLLERPEKRAMKRSLVELLNRVIREDLTEKQRRAIHARFLYGIPPSHIAREMGTSRGAVYKLLHDARTRLKQALKQQGLDATELRELLD